MQSMSHEDRHYQSRIDRLEEKLASMDCSLTDLRISNKKMNIERDSLKDKVDYIRPMRSLVHNAKSRDRVGYAMEFKQGDAAIMKTHHSR